MSAPGGDVGGAQHPDPQHAAAAFVSVDDFFLSTADFPGPSSWRRRVVVASEGYTGAVARGILRLNMVTDANAAGGVTVPIADGAPPFRLPASAP